MGCVLALSMDWLVLKGYWNAHPKRLRIDFFPCKPRNKGRKLWKCCYRISWHIYICIRTTSFLQTEVLWYGRVVVCFSLRQFQNIVPHSRFRPWFRFGLRWSTTSNPCPYWMWYSHQGWYKKQSCQRRSWLLPLTVRIWQGHWVMKWLLMLRSFS